LLLLLQYQKKIAILIHFQMVWKEIIIDI
jgi:hypothetical protein